MKTTLLSLLFLVPLVMSAQYRSEVWCPDQGDGTYINPVINADYSDPDVCAVGDDYYLVASSFNCMPGLPILHSKDLVNWTIIGHALNGAYTKDFSHKPAHGKGVWAPSIRYHNGMFYIYWGDPDYGIFVVTSKYPDKGWTAPVCVVEGRGLIDPCPLWDDDGRCYLVNAWANSRCGFNSVLTIRELSPDGMKVIGSPRIVFDGGQINHTTEGPKLYKYGGYYWIMCPAGGVEMGWQLAMRSKSPYGPYEWKRVLEQGSSNIAGPHQGAWVHTPYGEDWFLHFHDKGALGRVVFLQPVDWSSGWPIMGKDRQPLARYKKPKSCQQIICNPQESDEFNSLEIGKQWQWNATYQQQWGMPTSDGCIRLYTADSDSMTNFWDAGNMLLQKMPADSFTATAKMRMAAKEENQLGGIVCMGSNYSALVVNYIKGQFVLQQLDCNNADQGGKEKVKTILAMEPTERDTIPYSPAVYLDIILRLTVTNGMCTFSYSQDGNIYYQVGEKFIAQKGRWIGAKVGLVAMCTKRKSCRGWIDADWFRITR